MWVPIELPEIPPEMRECDKPVSLVGALDASQAVRLWSQDRYAQVECRANLKATQAFYDDLRERMRASAEDAKR